MRYSTSTLLALVASPFLVLAASSANPFNVPTGGYNVTAGQPVDLTWSPTTSGTVSLILRSGASSDLQAGTYIAQGIDNSGDFTWTPDTSITRGSDYTVEIVDDSDPSQTNYTPYFVIESKNTVASTTSDITLGASTATGSSSSATASTSSSATTTNSSASSASASASSASASKSASASASASSSSAAAASTTTSGSSSTTTAASFQSTSASAGLGAPRATAAAGLMGLIALGAMAL